MMVRIRLVVIGILILLMSMLAGCGGNEKAATVDSDAKKPSAADSKGGDIDKAMAEIKGLPGYSCEMIISGEGTQNITSKLWASGAKWRMEMETDGIKSVMLINSKGEIWSYMPAENLAMKMPAPPEAVLPTDWAETEDKPQVIGQEEVDGYVCLVVTYPEEKDTKCWIMKDRGLPVKIESMVNGKKTVIQYKKYNLNKQPDDLFEIPAGAQVMSLPGAS